MKYDVLSTVTALHSRGGAGEEQPYPHLHTLLHFDTQVLLLLLFLLLHLHTLHLHTLLHLHTQGFLDVLSIAFEEEEFATEVGRCQQQRLVDLLVEVMVGEEAPFSAAQVGLLFLLLRFCFPMA